LIEGQAPIAYCAMVIGHHCQQSGSLFSFNLFYREEDIGSALFTKAARFELGK
jgi:hypothetical protein